MEAIVLRISGIMFMGGVSVTVCVYRAMPSERTIYEVEVLRHEVASQSGQMVASSVSTITLIDYFSNELGTGGSGRRIVKSRTCTWF